jgi:hypothetical protein
LIPQIGPMMNRHITIPPKRRKERPATHAHAVAAARPKTLGPYEKIRKEVDASRKILELKPDWDGQGSPAYGQEVWKRATDFLLRHVHHLYRHHDILIPPPRINPGPDGSIDIHWKKKKFELLLNFPSDARLPAGFYGDDYGAVKIKGKIRTDVFNQGFLLWLMDHL